VAAARATRWRELPEALGPLAQYAAPECLSAIATPGVNTDAALVVLQSLISRMEVIADGVYLVEHDQSKNLLTYHELLQRFSITTGKSSSAKPKLQRSNFRSNSLK